MRLLGNDAGRDAHRDGVGGNALEDDGVGPDVNVVSDSDISEDLGAGADVDVVADLGGARGVDVFQANGDSVTDDAIATKLGVTADDDSAEVVDPKTRANRSFAGELDPGQDLGHLVRELVKEGVDLAQRGKAYGVAPAAKPVNGHGPETLLGPVALIGVQVGFQVFEECVVHWS